MKKIFLLMGPSGSGKSTLGEYLETLGIPRLVSHTTRSPRKNEVNGVDYYFVTEEEFKSLDMIEEVVYAGHCYGLSKKEVQKKLAKYDFVYSIVELRGVQQIKQVFPNEVVIIFITIPLEEMEKRMRMRGDSEEAIQKRIKHAIDMQEHEHGKIAGAKYTIENMDLEKSKKILRDIIATESSFAVGQTL